MLSFNDYQIAFSYKSDKELKKSYYIFKYLFSSSVVKLGKFLLSIANKLRFPVKILVKNNVFRHFCGGENLSECQKTANEIYKFNVHSILDYSVESGKPELYKSTFDEICKTIDIAKSNIQIPFAVFKPSAFADIKFLENASRNISLVADSEFYFLVDELCKYAYQNDVKILIDAEDFSFQNTIDFVAKEMMRKYNKNKAIVFNTFQMYRKDRLKYLTELISDSEKINYHVGAKLVRGAYMEKERKLAKEKGYESPINESKEETDKMFDNALKLCINHINNVSIFCGTHNEKSINLLINLLNEFEIDKNNSKIWFSQLYGMSDNISFKLAKEGYNIAKYIPYGPVNEVMPYLLRRADENTSVKGQASRELEMINSEIKRRKINKILL